MKTENLSIRRLALVLLGLAPVIAMLLIMAQLLLRSLMQGSAGRIGANTLLGFFGVLLLVLPQLLLEGFTGPTLWVATGASAILFAIVLVSAASPLSEANWANALTLVAAVIVISGPAVWRLVSGGEYTLFWVGHPNVWAAMVVMAVAASVPLYRNDLRAYALVFLTLAAVIVTAATGSRTALFAVAAGLIAELVLARVPGKWSCRAQAVVLLGLCVGVTVVLVSPLGARLSGLLTDKVRNLVVASEELDGSYWTKRGVDITPTIGDDGLRQFLIRSTDGRALDRVHQRFLLQAGQVRTLAFEYTTNGTESGIVAFSEPEGRMIVPLDSPNQAFASGSPELLSATVEPVKDGWMLARITVVNPRQVPVVWRVGFSPRLSGKGSAYLSVRHIRMSVGDEDFSYEPSYEATRVRELAALSAGQRFGYALSVLGLLAERPLFGHGSAKLFYELLDDFALGDGMSASNRPQHAHSLIGDVLVRFGLAGLLGLLTLLVVAVRALPSGKRSVVLPFVVVIFVLGVGDATFFSAGGPFVLGFLLLSTYTG